MNQHDGKLSFLLCEKGACSEVARWSCRPDRYIADVPRCDDHVCGPRSRLNRQRRRDARAQRDDKRRLWRAADRYKRHLHDAGKYGLISIARDGWIMFPTLVIDATFIGARPAWASSSRIRILADPGQYVTVHMGRGRSASARNRFGSRVTYFAADDADEARCAVRVLRVHGLMISDLLFISNEPHNWVETK